MLAAPQVLRDPKQKRFFKSRDIHDLFTLGDQYAAGGSETAAIFSSLHGGLEVPLDPDALAVPVQDAAAAPAQPPGPAPLHHPPALRALQRCCLLLYFPPSTAAGQSPEHSLCILQP